MASRRHTRSRARPRQPTTRPTPVVYIISHASPTATYRHRFPPDRPPRWNSNARPPISYYVALFDDADFWRDTLAFVGALGDAPDEVNDVHLVSTYVTREVVQGDTQLMRGETLDLFGRFWRHYRALPPVEFLAVYYRQGFAVMAGRW